MTEKVENLILDHLRHIREKVSGLENGQKDIKAELLSLKQALHSMQGDALRREQTIAGIQVNMDRIKTRLDLKDS